jgi:hypothetical protein
MRRSTATAALDHCTGDHAWKEKSGFILLEEESSECMVDDGLMGVFFFPFAEFVCAGRGVAQVHHQPADPAQGHRHCRRR